MSKKELRINEEVDVTEVRLIAENSEMMGVVSIEDAVQAAADQDLDLVEIAPTATPPVCRLMDYGKYKYKQQKKLHDQRKKSHGSEIKQLRIKTFRIDQHDLNIKLRKGREFLESGHRLLITLMFRGREPSHVELGEALLNDDVTNALSDIAKVETRPRREGRRMTIMFAPLPNIDKIVAKRKAAEEKAARDAELGIIPDTEENELDDMPEVDQATDTIEESEE